MLKKINERIMDIHFKKNENRSKSSAKIQKN